MDIKMEVDKIFASIGDEISYKMTLTNKENRPLKNVWIMNVLPSCMRGLNETITINEFPSEGVIEEGIFLDTIRVGESKVVTFKVGVIGLPENNPIIQTTEVSFVEEGEEEKKELSSNAVILVVTDANIRSEIGTFSLAVDKEVVSQKDTLGYTVKLINQGNCMAEHIQISHLAPTQTKLIPESIRGVKSNQIDRQDQFIYIEKLQIGEIITLQYEVSIEDEIVQYELPHQVVLNYTFIGADKKKVLKEVLSPTVFSKICLASFDERGGGIVKTAPLTLCTGGDEITYHIKLTNLGNVTATHMVLMDTLAKGVLFIPETLRIDNKDYLNESSIEKGIQLPDVKSSDSLEIIYKVRVKEGQVYEEKLESQACIFYEYEVGEVFIREKNYSNKIEIDYKIGLIDEEVFKLIGDKSLVSLDDELIYSMKFQNIGNIDILSIHLVLDKPKGIVVIGEGWKVEEENAYFYYDQPLKVKEEIEIIYPLLIESIEAIGKIKIGCHVTYTYLAGERIIEKHFYKNGEQEITMICASLQKEDGGIIKTIDRPCIAWGESAVYTTLLTNTGNVLAADVKLRRLFKGNEAIAKEEEYFIEIGDIYPQESKMITYDFMAEYMPKYHEISSKDQIYYEYGVGKELKKVYSESEEVLLFVEEACLLNLEGKIKQRADKKVCCPKDRMTYVLELTNRGNRIARDIKLYLPELEDGTWIGDSMIELKQLEVGEIYQLTYNLRVNAVTKYESIICSPVLSYVFEMSTGIVKERVYQVEALEVPIYKARLISPLGDLQAQVDKIYGTIGDEITCTIRLFNEGNQEVKEGSITPKILRGMSLKEETEVIPFSHIAPGEMIEISYTVKIEEYEGELILESELLYTYGGREIKEITVADKMTSDSIWIRRVKLGFSKIVDKLYVTKGERISYTLTYRNEGDIEILDVQMEEILPKGVRICRESIEIAEDRGYSLPNKPIVVIEKIAAKETIEVSFQVEVEEDLKEEQVEEVTLITYKSPIEPMKPYRVLGLEPSKSSFRVVRPEVEISLVGEQKVGLVEDILDYRLELINRGNIDLKDILVAVEGQEEVKIEVMAYKALENIRIAQLKRDESVILELKIHIISRPRLGEVSLLPKVCYAFDMENGTRENTIKGQVCYLRIETLSLELSQKSDKDFIKVEIGDEIAYQIKLKNTGTVPINQVELYNEIAGNTSLIAGSLEIGGLPILLDTMKQGVHLGKIDIGQILIITYKVRVEGYYSKRIINKVYAEYRIRKESKENYIKGQTGVIVQEVRMKAPSLATLTYRNGLILPYQYVDIDKILDFQVQPLIISHRLENWNHLLIKGQLKYKLVYIGTDKMKQSIEWIKVFTEVIEKERDLEDEKVSLQAMVEKEQVSKVNKRQVESYIVIGINED